VTPQTVSMLNRGVLCHFLALSKLRLRRTRPSATYMGRILSFFRQKKTPCGARRL